MWPRIVWYNFTFRQTYDLPSQRVRHDSFILLAFQTLKLEAIISSETFVKLCRTAWRHTADDNTPHSYRWENHFLRQILFQVRNCWYILDVIKLISAASVSWSTNLFLLLLNKWNYLNSKYFMYSRALTKHITVPMLHILRVALRWDSTIASCS